MLAGAPYRGKAHQMILALQAIPLLLLVGLLSSGRAGPVPAVLAALAAALPGIALSVPDLPAFLAQETARAAFLALKPILVVAGGLLFHAAVTREGTAAPHRAEPRRIFVATLLAGSFLESVTGFGVGAVFALSALRGMGLSGAPAGAMALLSLYLVPWGGLGPGTALGAALVGLPAQELAEATAWRSAFWLPVLGPVLWRLCAAAGIAVPGREKLAQMAVLLGMAVALPLSHRILPFEVVGIVVSGVPLLGMLWRLHPPRGMAGWRAALRRLAPYAGLTAALLLARGWRGAPSWDPFPGLPGFPLTHVAVVLWVFAALLLVPRGRAGLATGAAALRRARRPALAMLLYVVLAGWLSGSGAAAALAGAVAGALGPLAPHAVPVLALLSGIATGSNVGSNATMMPVQAALGQAAGLPPLLAPSVQNFAGSAGAGASFAGTAMICGLLADGTRPGQLWRPLLPSLLAVLTVGWISLTLLD